MSAGVKGMRQKLPYYMAYPMPLLYDDDRIERMDFEYMKSLYPEMPKKLLPYVEEECERMEYANSMMYDEYPDKLQLFLMCQRICKKIQENELEFRNYDEKNGKGKFPLQDLVEVMMYQELYKRRCDNRKKSRWFY